ncbi:refilin-B isoform X2 [Ahaetulla prasina]|uniref:refilin-B isoform X2 n=1 Tax=Ahaetulla prasina TaxID=499056 RepID=UPI0026489BCC|nr:refilin-B isoform X2 [Ahaetulla prasina]
MTSRRSFRFHAGGGLRRRPRAEGAMNCGSMVVRVKLRLNRRAGEPSSSPNPLRLCPLSFGEGVAFDPLPPKDVRYTSSVKYDSEKHFINNVYMPVRLGVSSCSQTIICVPDSTWRSYKAEVQFHLCNRPGNFTSTTIVYPKHTKTVYTTTLDYNCKKFNRKFLSSVELESSGIESRPESC